MVIILTVDQQTLTVAGLRCNPQRGIHGWLRMSVPDPLAVSALHIKRHMPLSTIDWQIPQGDLGLE